MRIIIESIGIYTRVTVLSCSSTPLAVTYGYGRNQQYKLAKRAALLKYKRTHADRPWCICGKGKGYV